MTTTNMTAPPTFGEMTTKELFDAYFETKGYNGGNTRNSVDRDEIYEMEEKLGKPFIEFTAEECIELIKSFGGGKKFSLNSYTTWISVYRRIFNFYSDNVKLIRNPFNDERFRRVDQLSKVFGFSENKLTMEVVDSAIGKVNTRSSSIERARYLECLMRLFLDGVRSLEELVTICSEQINFEELTITMDDGVVVHLSERTAYLLVVVHEMETMPCGKRRNYMVAWQNHYLKYPSRVKDIDDRSQREICGIVSKMFSNDIRRIAETDITYQRLYYLGVYEHLRKKFGDEILTQMLTSDRKRGKIIDDFQNAVVEYGVSRKSVYSLKRMLTQYL